MKGGASAPALRGHQHSKIVGKSNSGNRRAIRITGGVAIILTAMASIALVGACLSGLVVGLVRQFAVTSVLVAAQSSTVGLGATPTTVPTAASQPTPDWRIVRESDFGFRLDIPGVLSASHGFFINGTNGQGVDLAYNGAPLEDAVSGWKRRRGWSSSSRTPSPT